MVMRTCGDYGGGFIDCYAQNGGGGGHFYESVKNGLESFRLRDDYSAGTAAANVTAADLLLNDDTSSIASKKRIDSLFKTTASVAGDESVKRTSGRDVATANRLTKSLTADDEHYHGGGADYFDYGYAADNNNNKNTVQEKIEKMFAEISSSELDTDVSMESAATVGCNKYHVQYIGCASLSGKISSLEGLQQPVRDMYFDYRENQHLQHYRVESHHGGVGEGPVNKGHNFSGLLEISAVGLTIRYRDEAGDMVHRIDPFPSIAVWAALKYVCRRRSPPPSPQHRRSNAACTSSVGYEYAFLPLIADPDGSDKAPLFRDVDAGDRARLDAAGDHAPVFAVVTRKAGKRLECHGFACETENDALMMAANLYGALVAAMSSAAAGAVQTGVNNNKDDADERRATSPVMARRVIRQRNGFTSMSSTAGSSVGGGDVAPALPPPRPPRRNKKAASSTTSSVGRGGGDGDGTSVIGADDGDGVCSDAKTFRMTIGEPPSLQRGVCNSSSSSAAVAADVQQSSARCRDEKKIKKHSNNGGGDILTKVAIPRSKSFLNSNGLASTKYSRRAAGCGIETAAVDRRRRRSNGSSVMGFSDMFNELRLQEGLNNMDEILNAIINVEGMSYNDLKPIYREFLIKLAMTLTKDELYQRTKVIMTEQKRKRNNKRRKTPAVPLKSAGRGRRLNEKLRDALNLRAAKSRIGAVLLPGFCKRNKRNSTAPSSHQKQRRCSCSVIGSDIISTARKSAECRKNQRRNGKRPVGAALKSRRQQRSASSPVCSTSDDSDFFAVAALRQRQHLVQQQQQKQLQQQQKQLQQQQQQKQMYRKSKARVSKRTGSSGCGRGTTTATTSEGGCLHQASSGYFSCSECSAGTADDKCYCGAGGIGDAEPASLVSCSCDSDSCADSDKCYCGRLRRARNIFDELKSRGFAASESSVSRADSPGTAWKKNEQLLLQQRGHDPSCSGGPGGGSSSAATGIGGGGGSGIEPSKSIEYLKVTRRPLPVDQHYSSVTKPAVDCSRMKVYGGGGTADSASTAAGSSSSPSSSLSAATVYSSSSAVEGGHHQHRRPQGRRRSGSSGSDNFRAIDYALFANNSGVAAITAAKKYYRAAGCLPPDGRRRAAAVDANAAAFSMNRSYSSEAVHNMTSYRVYHHNPHGQPGKINAARRHSVHDGGDDVLASFFCSDIEHSLGYYP
ncbi:Hypothetical protein CINCED_3A016259 [Cinara cedri]|nr:Hypothetical protein CINCED_3A016259 [Cinara cedri]